MQHRLGVWFGLLCIAGLIILEVGCGSSGGGSITPTPKPTAAITASPATITSGKSSTLTWSSTNANSCTASGAWSGSLAMSGSQAVTPTATSTYKIACTGDGGTANASATVTVTSSQNLTVTVSPTTATITTGGTVNLSAGSSGGSGSVTFSWSMNPSLGGLSPAAGSAATYTAPANLSTSPEQVTVTVTGTDGNSATSSASVAITITSATTRAITGFGPFDVECDKQCVAAVLVHGSGFTSSDKVKTNPSANLVGSSYVDSSAIQVQFGFTDTTTSTGGSDWNPGAYAINICASDGTQCSPTGYLSFGGAGGNLGGATSTEEFHLSPGSNEILKFKLSDGSADGAITNSQNPKVMWGIAFAVDDIGNNLIFVGPGGISVYDATNPSLGDGKGGVSTQTAAQVAGKNGIVGWSDPTNQSINFFNPNQTNRVVATDANAGTARAIAMTAGCGGTDTFSFDEQGLQLVRDSVTITSSNGNASFTRKGSSDLSSGFSAASQINYGMYRRFVLTTDSACEAAVLAPVVTGTNQDRTTNFAYALAIVDGNTMTPLQLQFKDANGNSVTNPFLTNQALTAYVKDAVMAPTGNAVYVETENVADGSSGLVKIAWTTVSGSTVAVTVTDMGTVSPTGGFFGTSMVMDPKGTFVDLGMRTEPIVRVPLN